MNKYPKINIAFTLLFVLVMATILLFTRAPEAAPQLILAGLAVAAVKEPLMSFKDGLPMQAFAVIGVKHDNRTWELPHHSLSVLKDHRRGFSLEKSVDWEFMEIAVSRMALGDYRYDPLVVLPEAKIEAARHMAAHYRAAGKPVPDILQAFL
ncbi:MAG: hypothetical protein U1D67_09635 [Dehalococcoidia bacterium]|nr:hypothetical protein [Dehalococcoidia bacterium]